MKMTTRNQWLKNFTLGAGLTLASFLLFTGCATPVTTPSAVVTPAQPAQTVLQVTPATPTAPAVTNYVILPASPAVTNYVPVVTSYNPNAAVMQAVTYAQEAAPLIPAPYGAILTGVASLAALIAGYVAQKKNTQLASSQAAGAAMASVIAAQPALTAQAMTAAATNGSTAAVATHIAAANSPT
jgi:hypothetical protein